MELPFCEFDLILGMNWLIKHQVLLDCAAKRVNLKTLGRKQTMMVGERRDYLSNVISALVRKGCKAYLAYILDTSVSGSSVESICTVREYLDREVEFGTDLLPETSSVSIDPYRMAPKELVELKAQLQELLDK
ncbi:DNA/RNA polymerases superfamily protein [Gossypium australe]|uniref:DNA/RNA polymerases superfamily protein n=1 Tax=Gossypium australe TaxID=47621 RepID=A0A5B6VZ67_9ROSI|nr:DNA/RNA polymerases superfamily protein [Gossypium australe]